MKLYVAALACAVAIGCSVGPSHPSDTTTTPTSPREVIIVDSGEVTSDIGPEGGTITHALGAKIVIPVGALAQRTHITLIAKNAPTEKALAATPLGVSFEAGPDGQQFLKPVKVIVPFDPARLPPNTEASRAQIRMAPHGSTNFEALASLVDLAGRTIETETIHFTEFVPAQDPNPVFITAPTSLPNGSVGASYAQSFDATGGSQPYSWTLSSGSLPNGLSLSTGGALAGTPSAAASSAFFVKVSDTQSRSVQKAFTLLVEQTISPTPMLGHIDPTSTVEGSTNTTVNVFGTNFIPSSVATWDGTPLPTAFVSPTQLATTIGASLLTTASTHQIAVATPAPGGGTSTSTLFTVNAIVPLNPKPTITAVNPATLPITNVDTQITITGSNFITTTSAVIGDAGQGLSTLYVSPTTLYASIPASYLMQAATLRISVYNPPPSGGFSTVVSIAVTDGGIICKKTITTFQKTANGTCLWSGPIADQVVTFDLAVAVIFNNDPGMPRLCIVNAPALDAYLNLPGSHCLWPIMGGTNTVGTLTVSDSGPRPDVSVSAGGGRNISVVDCRRIDVGCGGHELTGNINFSAQ
jgi:hypothetical protein